MTTLEQFHPHSSSHPIAQACWSSNNQYLVSSSTVGDKLVLSSLKSSPVPVVELAEGKKQTRVCLSSSSQFLVSGGLDCGVHIWDLKTKRLHRSLEDHKEEVTCVSFNANDSHIASGSTSGDLILHSLITNVSSRPFGHGSNQPIHDLRMSSLRRSLLGSVSDSGTVVLWDSNTQKELHVFESVHKAPGSGLSFSPASELLVVSVGLDKKIVCYDTASKIVVRSIRVDSPLTAVDFSVDGTGLVVGSTQGKIYHYDLRNSSAPTRVTPAHKTSVTSLRFQCGLRQKSSKHGSSKVGSSKKSSSRALGSGHSEPSPQRELTTGGAAGDPVLTPQPLPVVEKFNNIGRNSLDVFSPVRDDSRTLGSNGDTPLGRTHVGTLELLSREGEGQPLTGRASLDIFSPVREDLHSGSNSFRKTPLGTALGASLVGSPLLASAGRYTPLQTTFMTPPSIKEEEPTHNAPEPKEPLKFDKGSSSSSETEAAPTPEPQATNHSTQPKTVLFSPEPNGRRGDILQTHLSYDSPAPAQAAAAAGPALSAAASSTLVQNMADTASQNGAPFTSLQMHFIQNMIHETLEDLRDACHKDIINLQVEMVRQFYIQLNELHHLMEHYSVNESLVEEVQRLREENRKLRTNY
uniref:NEDD1 gamma-tubulin ring complex targeting factor n=1 Tax=Knipowitschia caucasica TaxID=637954 RepID=A0AAV2KPR9_KNICA